MKKADLKTGMRVTTKGGCKYIVFLNCRQNYNNAEDFIVNSKNSLWNKLSYYNEDLSSAYAHDNIVKVEIPNHPYQIFQIDSEEFTVIWTREEPSKAMTIEEIQQALGYKIKVVETK